MLFRNWSISILPAIKKGDKIKKSYCPISLTHITGNTFQRLLYSQMTDFYIRNTFISQNQSGFKPGRSCINQLLAITRDLQIF